MASVVSHRKEWHEAIVAEDPWKHETELLASFQPPSTGVKLGMSTMYTTF